MRSRCWLLTLLLLLAGAASAEEMVFQLDPGQSTVEFTLGDVLHTVHGHFRINASAIHFDSQTGFASGAFVVDAASGHSGSKGRDRKMQNDILESAKFPEIRFTLQKVEGPVLPAGTSRVQMIGIMSLHGSDHPVSVEAPVHFDQGRATADVHFVVPYVQWGLKNPSTFILRVGDKVDIAVHAVGTLAPDSGTSSQNH